LKKWRRNCLKKRNKREEKRSKKRKKMMIEHSERLRRREESKQRESDCFKKKRIEDKQPILLQLRKLNLERLSIKKHQRLLLQTQLLLLIDMMSPSKKSRYKSNTCKLSLLI